MKKVITAFLLYIIIVLYCIALHCMIWYDMMYDKIWYIWYYIYYTVGQINAAIVTYPATVKTVSTLSSENLFGKQSMS